MAALNGHTTAVALLLSKGANLNAQDVVSMWCICTHPELLIINVGSNQGYGPPLCYAAASGCAAVVELLLSKGADVHTVGRVSPWWVLCLVGSLFMIDDPSLMLQVPQTTVIFLAAVCGG